MLGAIIGDIVGSVYEVNNLRTTEFELFINESYVSDDSVLTVADAILRGLLNGIVSITSSIQLLPALFLRQ